MAVQVNPAEIIETAVARKQQKIPPAPVVLVVEDDSAVRQFLEIALRGFDFDVRSAANGREAVEIYRCGGIDIVLMDVQMPKLDGPAVLAQLKKINPTVVCCFISASTGNYQIEDLMTLGAVGFLQKPFHLEELRQLVMDAVG